MNTHYIEPEAGITACCSRTPAELPRDQRIAYDQAEVTCAGRVNTYEEWRVTGTFSPDGGDEDEPYEFTWSRGHADPEAAARNFVKLSTGNGLWGWTDGPHLHKRTVTVSEWTEVDA